MLSHFPTLSFPNRHTPQHDDPELRSKCMNETAAKYSDEIQAGASAGNAVSRAIEHVFGRLFTHVLATKKRQNSFGHMLKHIALAIDRLKAQADSFADPSVPSAARECQDSSNLIFVESESGQNMTCNQLGSNSCKESETFRMVCTKTCDPACIMKRRQASEQDAQLGNAAKQLGGFAGGVHRSNSVLVWDSSFQRLLVDTLGLLLGSLFPSVHVARGLPKAGPIIDSSEVDDAAAALQRDGFYKFSPRGRHRTEFWMAVRQLQRAGHEQICQDGFKPFGPDMSNMATIHGGICKVQPYEPYRTNL